MEINLLTYKEVLEDLNNSHAKNNLLLGNGFNLSLGINTSYERNIQLYYLMTYI